MRSEPPINAEEVKGVATLREQANDLPVMELAETNGTVSAVDYSITRLINPSSDRGDRVLVESLGADVPYVVLNLTSRKDIFVVVRGDVCSSWGLREISSPTAVES
ncbi:hypothetical protein HPP92_004089 [Vanilla planifolia]|uniref:Uncharacterized protein n=1 Tax=Vanilla planifolia TaxID=51239 RepID=A0A835S8S5_VANPL|nr:hypothetical protein HPP92_004089 [Vanilla planifolia]